jgi:hypothetical protein
MKLREILFILLILPLCSQGFAQGRRELCKLTIESAPTLRGIHIGMSLEETSKTFKFSLRPKKILIEKDYEEFDALTKKTIEKQKKLDLGAFRVDFVIGDELLKANPDLKGINLFYGEYFNNKLYHFKVYYDKNFYSFVSTKEFVSTVAVLLDIPEQMWLSENNSKDHFSFVRCSDFNVYAKIIFFSNKIKENDKEVISLSVTNTNTEREIDRKFDEAVKRETEEQKKKEKETKKKAAEKIFKP